MTEYVMEKSQIKLHGKDPEGPELFGGMGGGKWGENKGMCDGKWDENKSR